LAARFKKYVVRDKGTPFDLTTYFSLRTRKSKRFKRHPGAMVIVSGLRHVRRRGGSCIILRKTIFDKEKTTILRWSATKLREHWDGRLSEGAKKVKIFGLETRQGW
jgi:hypothetical protein